MDVESGYSNGQVRNPSYEQVCTGQTGHNEVVRLQFDPARISLREILEIFFVVHDPTTLNRQGNDAGTYRSGIYTTTDAQQATAREVIAELAANQVYRGAPIVTEVAPLSNYWPAEAYHQDYSSSSTRTRATAPSVFGPKVEKGSRRPSPRG